MCKDGKICFIHWANLNKKDCCFNNAENGLKVCKCGQILPKNQKEFDNWFDIIKNKGK